MNYDLTNPYEIAKFIKETVKSTPVKAYIKGPIQEDESAIKFFGAGNTWTLFGESDDILDFIEKNESIIEDYVLENDRRNSAIPLLDLKKQNCRIEPGSFIRDKVALGNNCVIMMGAVINIGASIDDNTMIDMNAVLGARTTVGKNVHVGAGAVLAGVLEPPSATPVIVEDGVLIGANAVVLEGVRIGKNAVVAAGAIVTSDVPEGAVVAGSPAKVVKQRDAKTDEKTELLDDLRG
ncbi:2,3,4,5-tetrahydropyridine-2,6-dicarboxylate N-acetyltransferase [Acidaminobacter sp. JC074]|uniref:2,3,4,5-tetrahydropyridine-2,6-dicarboxylate N-acetyltransferase n=1 Tax=Acidaminobacter sp. JC074 TaxID=2530199 RepID=UPI001F10248E|nr:2,3,4,5-tetrahydropyridine-2,6-dicarboxylate N-acetyltransferase [Acidaminobacter sp. JC074]MCH4891268.1 2,3,4,5-tetrahydropyridine-2,6-dicarboxylate N-acetyltransferase [Acidaminobacter sp. JC074]